MGHYLLTSFIEPLKRKIPLSSEFGYYFDNPRTKGEVRKIKKILLKAWEQSGIWGTWGYWRLPLTNETEEGVITYEFLIEKLLLAKTKLWTREISEQIEFLKGDKDRVLEFFSKNWIILRIDNEETRAEEARLKSWYKAMKARWEKGFIMLDDDHVFFVRENRACGVSHIISMLATSGVDWYSWKSFLLTKDTYRAEEFYPDIAYLNTLFNSLLSQNSRVDDTELSFSNFECFYKKAKPAIALLDKAFKTKKVDLDKLDYIGKRLNDVYVLKNEYSALLEIIGLIEMLLTHQPDYYRFNIEDSISKQFILKTAIVSYEKNGDLSLAECKKKLKSLYEQRSNIAHWNFDRIQKFKKNLKEDEYYEDLIIDAYFFLKNVLTAYLEDPEYIDFLKDN